MSCLEVIFAPLQALYCKATKREPSLVSQDAVKLQDTDQQARAYIKQKETQIQKKDNQNKKKEIEQQGRRNYQLKGSSVLPDQNTLLEETTKEANEDVDLVLRLEIDMGDKSNQSRIECWKQLYFKINLLYSPFFLNFSSFLQRQINHPHKTTIDTYPREKLENTPQWKILQLQQQPTTNFRDCACCLSYVYADEDLAFPPFPHPISYFTDIDRHGSMQMNLTEQMVSYLNGRGGVLLIGCSFTKDNRIIPKLATTLEHIKDQIQSKLRSYVETIYPPVQLKKQIDLSFIPVARNPYQRLSLNPRWLQGTYILRIIVTPTEPQSTYFYQYNKLIHYAYYNRYANVPLKQENIYQFMKKRYYQFNQKVQGGLRDKGNVVPAVAKHNGPCRAVEKGSPIFAENQHRQFEETKLQPNAENPANNPLLAERAGYKSVSLLVVDRQALSEIKHIFCQKQKFETVIDKAFPAENFRLSNNTWLVWHNVKFQKLINGIKKDTIALKQKNYKKPVLLISTCNSLKLLSQKKLTKDQVQSIKEFACSRSNEKVDHKQIDNYEYFKCTSVITAVLIYYYIAHNYKFKSVFQKIPTGTVTKHKHAKPNAAKVPPAKGKHTTTSNQDMKYFEGPQSRYEDESSDRDQEPAYHIQQPYKSQRQSRYQITDRKQGYRRNQQHQQLYSNEKEMVDKYHQRDIDKSRRSTINSVLEKQAYEFEEEQQQQLQILQPDSLHQVYAPKCIFSTFDQLYNVWRQYCDNGIVHFTSPDGVYVGNRPYEKGQLQQIYVQLNAQNIGF